MAALSVVYWARVRTLPLYMLHMREWGTRPDVCRDAGNMLDGSVAWERSVADDVRRVLNHIVSRYVVDDELRSIDRDAPHSAGGDSIESDKQDAARREVEHADELADAFSAGLVRAYQRSSVGGHELPLDDRKPEENRIADALIQFLVSYDLASSRTEQTGPMHYTYYIAVDWPRLRSVADAAGVDLERVLAQHAGRARR